MTVIITCRGSCDDVQLETNVAYLTTLRTGNTPGTSTYYNLPAITGTEEPEYEEVMEIGREAGRRAVPQSDPDEGYDNLLCNFTIVN